MGDEAERKRVEARGQCGIFGDICRCSLAEFLIIL